MLMGIIILIVVADIAAGHTVGVNSAFGGVNDDDVVAGGYQHQNL